MTHASLRRRTVGAIVTTAIVTSLLFGLVTFVFAYSIEDSLFETELAREVDRQRATWRSERSLPAPRAPYIRIYRNGTRLPADLERQFAVEPQRREFAGAEGRHYHIAPFALPGPSGGRAVAVAEGSRYLLVRPVRNNFILLLAGLSLTVALIAALIGWWLASRALSPLTRLAANLTDPDQPVPVIDPSAYPRNEIGTLARALGDAFERISGFVAREQRFTRDASHELRTPLAVIAGAAELLATNPDLSDSARPAIRRIETASADMAQSLDLLLAVARERHQLPPTPVALLPLVEKAIAGAAARFPHNLVFTSVDIDPAAQVAVDETLLQLVLVNLIGNAFQHASGSALMINGDGRRLVIGDTGPGLDRQESAFAPFTKGPDSSGSGLGLDIVKRLCASANIALETRTGEHGPGTHIHLGFPTS